MATVLHELLASAAERFPDRVAVFGPKSQLTYAELLSSSQDLSRALVAAGVKPATPVGLSMPKSPDAIIGAYGIMMAGACYVPIDPFTPPQRAVRVARNVDLRTIVTTADQLGKLVGEIAATNGPLTAIIPSTPPDELPFDVVARCWNDGVGNLIMEQYSDGSQLAYILHTSGSTGIPKGVAISHRNALAFVEMAAEFFSVTPDDRLCSHAPLHFDLSVFDLYVACQQGASIVILPEYYSAFPQKMVDAIDECGITIWNSVASALTLMMQRGEPERRSLDSVRLVLFSGEAMPVKYLRLLRKYMHGADLFNGYGQTEANTSTYHKIDSIPADDSWRIPIGRAFPGFDVFALDDDGCVIDRAGVEGELFVKSETVAQGYWGDPEATAERFVPDPRITDDEAIVYRTGDKVRLDNDRNFLFVGRYDDMVKSRGYRIELGEIDQVLLSCPGVEAAAAIALPDPVIGNRIVSFVSVAKNSSLAGDSVLDYCRSILPAYMVPESVTVRTELPRTSTGKIDRQSLKSQTS